MEVATSVGLGVVEQLKKRLPAIDHFEWSAHFAQVVVNAVQRNFRRRRRAMNETAINHSAPAHHDAEVLTHVLTETTHKVRCLGPHKLWDSPFGTLNVSRGGLPLRWRALRRGGIAR